MKLSGDSGGGSGGGGGGGGGGVDEDRDRTGQSDTVLNKDKDNKNKHRVDRFGIDWYCEQNSMTLCAQLLIAQRVLEWLAGEH
jgi:hypothetical protein